MAHHGSHSSQHYSSHSSHVGHILPRSVYFTVLFALIVLTLITVALAKYQPIVDLINSVNNLNIVIALLIASTKAVIVAMFFMHLKYEAPMTWLYAFFPILLLGFLIGGLFLDNPFRTDPSTGRSWKSHMQEQAEAIREKAVSERAAQHADGHAQAHH